MAHSRATLKNRRSVFFMVPPARTGIAVQGAMPGPARHRSHGERCRPGGLGGVSEDAAFKNEKIGPAAQAPAGFPRGERDSEMFLREIARSIRIMCWA